MKVENVKCPNCGANLEYDGWSRKYTCQYCKSTFRAKQDASTPSSSLFGHVKPPQISMEDLEEFVAPLENLVDDFGKAVKKFFLVATPIVLVVIVLIIIATMFF
jgi:DNA-directed RNA polymerase subunit RPC12/RpoP